MLIIDLSCLCIFLVFVPRRQAYCHEKCINPGSVAATEKFLMEKPNNTLPEPGKPPNPNQDLMFSSRWRPLEQQIIFNFTAHLSESRVLILRDYDDEPFVLDHGGRSINEGTEPNQQTISINSRNRPKKLRSSKKTVLQYGRPVYQFDDLEDLKELTSESSESKKPLEDGPVSYEYQDIGDLGSDDSVKDGDHYILSEKPLNYCHGEDCGDRKTFRKYDDHKDWKRKKNVMKFIKRFRIVNNAHQSRKEPKRMKYDSTENNHKKKKTGKKQHDNSEERSNESWGSNKKKKYNSEESREFTKIPKKKYTSKENWTHESNSNENVPKRKKKNKKKNYESSSDTERKSIAVEEDYVMQGNNIFHSNNRKKNKRYEEDRRRRLEHFLPKRYHWETEEIHDLGTFWFNGPKGAYPAPQRLN